MDVSKYRCRKCGQIMSIGFPILGENKAESRLCNWVCFCGNRSAAGYYTYDEMTLINTQLEEIRLKMDENVTNSYEDETNPSVLRWQRNNWQETARQSEVNLAFHREKRFALLKWLREISKIHPEFEALIPNEFKADYKMVDFWESER